MTRAQANYACQRDHARVERRSPTEYSTPHTSDIGARAVAVAGGVGGGRISILRALIRRHTGACRAMTPDSPTACPTE